MASLSSQIRTITFEDVPGAYKPGIPFEGKVKSSIKDLLACFWCFANRDAAKIVQQPLQSGFIGTFTCGPPFAIKKLQ